MPDVVVAGWRAAAHASVHVVSSAKRNDDLSTLTAAAAIVLVCQTPEIAHSKAQPGHIDFCHGPRLHSAVGTGSPDGPEANAPGCLAQFFCGSARRFRPAHE